MLLGGCAGGQPPLCFPSSLLAKAGYWARWVLERGKWKFNVKGWILCLRMKLVSCEHSGQAGSGGYVRS